MKHRLASCSLPSLLLLLLLSPASVTLPWAQHVAGGWHYADLLRSGKAPPYWVRPLSLPGATWGSGAGIRPWDGETSQKNRSSPWNRKASLRGICHRRLNVQIHEIISLISSLFFSLKGPGWKLISASTRLYSADMSDTTQKGEKFWAQYICMCENIKQAECFLIKLPDKKWLITST